VWKAPLTEGTDGGRGGTLGRLLLGRPSVGGTVDGG
jgi:hypothetical protein